MLPGSRRAHVGVVRAAGGEARAARRRAKTGEITVMSGRWVPPRNGSLRIQASPGACSSSSTAATGARHRAEVHGDVLGLHRPSGPSASNSAVEASRRSLMFAEWAERTSTAPISSHAARSAPSITWRAIGSSPLIASITTASPSRGRRPARRHHQRRAGQLDDRRPLDRRPRPGRGPRRRATRRRSARAGCRARSASPARRGSRLGAGQRHGHAHGHQLELGVRVGVAVALGVGAVERARAGRRVGLGRRPPPPARTPGPRSAGRRWRAPRPRGAPSSSRPRAASRLHHLGHGLARQRRRPRAARSPPGRGGARTRPGPARRARPMRRCRARQPSVRAV